MFDLLILFAQTTVQPVFGNYVRTPLLFERTLTTCIRKTPHLKNSVVGCYESIKNIGRKTCNVGHELFLFI